MIDAVADHDINDDMLRQLEMRLGRRLLRVRDFGMETTPDAEILEWAAATGRVVISHDVSTMTASANIRVARYLPMPGLIIVRQLAPIGGAVDFLSFVLEAARPEDLANKVLYIPG